MNLFQAANGAATFLILSSMIAGLAKQLQIETVEPGTYFLQHIPVLCLAFFMIFFRIKTLVDDHKHFGEEIEGNHLSRYIGFMLAVFSWLLWALAAYLLPQPVRSSKLMAASLLVSTLWVIVHLLEVRTTGDKLKKSLLSVMFREQWAVINICYIFCLGAYIGWFSPDIPAETIWPLVVLFLILIYDIYSGNKLNEVFPPPKPAV
jgi:hypothetical protein